MKPTLAYSLMILLLVCPPIVMAEEKTDLWLHEFRVGLLDHDTDGLWSGSKREDGVDINAELIFSPGYDPGFGIIRPHLGVTINNEGDTSKIYAGGTWQYEWKSGWFFDLGLGVAAHNGETETNTGADRKELGSKVLFRVAIEGGHTFNKHHRVSLMFDHISNGYLSDPNEGMDTLGIRYGYLF